HGHGDAAESLELKTRRRHDDVRLEFPAGSELNALFREGFDVIGGHAGAALANGNEQIGIRDKAETLFPWVVTRREVRPNAVVRAEFGARALHNRSFRELGPPSGELVHVGHEPDV